MATSLDLELLESAVSERSGALEDLRREALAQFQDSGLPTTRDEDWKYTNLAGAAKISNDWLAAGGVAATTPPSVRAAPADIDAVWITIADGQFDDNAIADANKQLAGTATISRLSAGSDRPGLRMDNAIASLNAALIEDAICIDVAKNATVEKPIGLFLLDHADVPAAASHAASRRRST